jgi:hypothetical protein
LDARYDDETENAIDQTACRDARREVATARTVIALPTGTAFVVALLCAFYKISSSSSLHPLLSSLSSTRRRRRMSPHPNLHNSQSQRYGATNGVPTKDAATINNVGGTSYAAANRKKPLKIAITGAGAAGLAAARIVSRSCNNDAKQVFIGDTTYTKAQRVEVDEDNDNDNENHQRHPASVGTLVPQTVTIRPDGSITFSNQCPLHPIPDTIVFAPDTIIHFPLSIFNPMSSL